MSGIVYAIGGGNILNQETKDIDLDIISSSNKINPLVLFIPTANNDRDDSTLSFINYYRQFTNNIEVLKLIDNNLSKEEVRKYFLKADIIYFAGGRTERLMEYANKYNFKDLIIEVLSLNKIVAGISAGAIMLFEEGYGDLNSYIYNGTTFGYGFTKGLGIFSGVFCPHYNSDGILSFNSEIKETCKNGYALSNGASLKIKDGKITIIKSKSASAYQFIKENNYILEVIK